MIVDEIKNVKESKLVIVMENNKKYNLELEPYQLEVMLKSVNFAMDNTSVFEMADQDKCNRTLKKLKEINF